VNAAFGGEGGFWALGMVVEKRRKGRERKQFLQMYVGRRERRVLIYDGFILCDVALLEDQRLLVRALSKVKKVDCDDEFLRCCTIFSSLSLASSLVGGRTLHFNI
jgi:hypothetical protein